MGARFRVAGWLAVIALTTAAIGQAKTIKPPTFQSNAAAARADAAKLLDEVATPANAVRLTAEPLGDNGYLKPAAHLSETTVGVVARVWLQLAEETPAQVIAAIEAVPPPGTTRVVRSSAGDAQTGTSAIGVIFLLPNVSNMLDARVVAVTATQLSGGDTGVIIQSQSVPEVPRTVGSMVPAATRVITVRETSGATVLRSATITSATRVRAGLAYVNNLEAAQPGVVSCGLQGAEPDRVTLQFLAKRGAAPLAQMIFSGDFTASDGGLSGVSGPCNPVSLRVGSQPEDPLLGGAYITALDRLLGARIP